MSEAITLRQWTDVVRRARLGSSAKVVALMLANYADSDGSRVFPGVARLSYECELSYTTVKKVLRKLRDLGLIEKVGRRGDADVYQLILHPDLLERVNVPTPSQVTAELERIRSIYRGSYKPSLRTAERSADAAPESQEPPMVGNLRTAQPSAEKTPADGFGTTETVSADAYRSDLRTAERSATYQDRATTDTSHSDEDLDSAVTLSRAQGREEDQISLPVDLATHPRCPHGRTARRNRQGQPRCENCRADEEVDRIASQAAAVQFGPTKCPDHGLKAGLRGDGKPHCPICRVMEAKAR